MSNSPWQRRQSILRARPRRAARSRQLGQTAYAAPQSFGSTRAFWGRGTTVQRRGGAETTSRSEEHTSELQSQSNLVCRLLLEKKKNTSIKSVTALGMVATRSV